MNPVDRDNGQFDTSAPLLICKTGSHPAHHGGLFLARSAGRVGIPVVAMVESRLTPLAASRYVAKRIPPLPVEPSPGQFSAYVKYVFEVFGSKPVLAATDDEAAVLIDENAHDLSAWSHLPAQRVGLSRQVASKSDLPGLCSALGVRTPATAVPESMDDLISFGNTATFPLIVKSRESFSRRLSPQASATGVLWSMADLERYAERFDPTIPVVVQEYVPEEDRQNLIYQGLRCSHSDLIVSFTGTKLRDYPVGAGETTLSMSQTQNRLRTTCERLLEGLDYRGVCDIDVLVDRRDDSLRLIDFNPRFGANAGTFRMRNGIDLVRAYHLDLTGRPIPLAAQEDGVCFQVKARDDLARKAGHRYQQKAPRATTAFWSRDDPAPAVISGLRSHGGDATRAVKRLISRVR